MWLTATWFDFVHFFSTWLKRYECYDKLFLTPLILNRLTRWLIPLFLTLFDFFYSYVALCHSWQPQSCHLDFFHLNMTPLMSIVVGLRSKPSLTSLRLKRSARWLVRLPSICLYVVHLEATFFYSELIDFMPIGSLPLLVLRLYVSFGYRCQFTIKTVLNTSIT